MQRILELPGNERSAQRLREVLAEGRAIAWVGAGASAGLYPMWGELLELLIREAVARGGATPGQAAAWRKTAAAHPQQAVRGIKRELGPGPFAEFISKTFGPKAGPAGKRYTPTHAALMGLPFRAFVTTNYDTALSQALRDARPSEPQESPSTWKTSQRLMDWLSDSGLPRTSTPILHAHGIYDDGESVVLGSGEYRRIYRDEFFLKILERLWLSERLVAVGVGFADPWFEVVAEELLEQVNGNRYRSAPHIALVGATSEELTADILREERRRLQEGYGVEPIFYPVEVDGSGRQDHGALLDLLRWLGQDPTAEREAPTAIREPAPALGAAAARLRKSLRDQADVLASVFRRAGGPQALSEVYVEVRLCGELLHADEGDEVFACARPWMRELLGHGRRKASGRRCKSADPYVAPGEERAVAGGEVFPAAPFPFERIIQLEHRRWVLLGDPGGGKTTLLRHLVVQLLDETQKTAGQRADEGTTTGGGRLPLFLKVADVREGEGLFTTLARLHGSDCDPVCREAVAHGRAVILLDGLDEAVDPSEAAAAVRRVAAEAGDCPLVVASRPLGYERPGGDFLELTICPLAKKEQRGLLLAWLEKDEARVDRALERLRRRPRLRRVAENPLLLTLVGLVMRDGHDIPERRGDLYRRAVRVLLARGADAGGRGSPGKHPRRRVLREPDLAHDALAWLALRLHGLESEAYPAGRIREALAEQPRFDRQVRLVWGDVRAFLEDVAETTGLLVPDAASSALAEGFHFPHRTFREYLAAVALVRDIGAKGAGDVPQEALEGAGTGNRAASLPPAEGQLGVVLEDGRGRPSLWSEVLALASGILGAPAGDALVRRVAAEGCADLTRRVVAEAEGVARDTVAAVLGLEHGWEREKWEARRAVLEQLPEMCSDLGVAVRLCWRFVQGTTNGNDLWFARELLRKIARGDVAGDSGELDVDGVRAEAADLAERVLEHLDDDAREQARALVLDSLRPIPAGSFLMGSPVGEEGRDDDEGPRHRVEFTAGFRVMSTPVTNELYDLFDPGHRAAWNESGDRTDGDAQDRHPVNHVTWYEAVLFAEWLGLGARLPRESEWEYACRAGTRTAYWSGAAEEDLARVGWYDANSGDRTHPVGEKPANPWGLHDMHGNVWEWCADEWDPQAYSKRDASLPVEPAIPPPLGAPGARRVIRGGGWWYDARRARSAYRNGDLPSNAWDGNGLRLVLPAAPARG